MHYQRGWSKTLIFAALVALPVNAWAQTSTQPTYFSCHSTITKDDEYVGKSGDDTFRLIGNELTVYQGDGVFSSACDAIWHRDKDRCDVEVKNEYYSIAVTYAGVRRDGSQGVVYKNISRVTGKYSTVSTLGSGLEAEGQCEPSQNPATRPRKI